MIACMAQPYYAASKSPPESRLTTQIALLRAINVGGKNKLPMAQLRTICAGLGWRDVRTYIQSGNIVFTAPDGSDRAALASSLAAAILQEAGLVVPVVVRDRQNLRRIAQRNPFPNATPKHLRAVFLSHSPVNDDKFDYQRSPPEELLLDEDTLYWHAPNGVARSKINTAYIERTLGVKATARNWNTVNKLIALSE